MAEEIIAGRVTKVINLKENRSRCHLIHEFTEYVVIYDRRVLPLELDDLLSFEIGKTETYKRTELQYVVGDRWEVVMPRGEKGVIRTIQRALSTTEDKALTIYESCIELAAKTGLSVVEWLDEVSESVKIKKRNDDLTKLHRWWIQHRLKRQIVLLHIPDQMLIDTMEFYSLNYYKLFQRLTTDPYRLLTIPMLIVLPIINKFEITYTQEQQQMAELARLVHSRIHHNGDSCVTRSLLPGSSDLIDRTITEYELREKFGFVFDDESYTATEIVANDIATRLSEPLGRTIEPQFSFDRITEKQKEAVTVALNSPIAIITGPGGSGKCLDPSTPVMLYSGVIVPIATIKLGDLLMGPDSTPRTVLSLARGIDQMYRIVPELGDPFICNAPHLLTLFAPPIHHHDQWYLIENQLLRILPALPTASITPDPHHLVDLPLAYYLQLLQLYPEVVGRYRLVHTEVNYQESIPPDSNYSFIPNQIKYGSRAKRCLLLERYLSNQSPTTNHSEFVRYQVIENNNKSLLMELRQVALSVGWLAILRENKLIIYKDSEMLQQSFRVESVGMGPYCGFELDGDGRFLLGDFTITHNTTIIKEIINNLKRNNISYLLTSFTGKAVTRIKEVTNDDRALTLHMTLGRISREEVLELGDQPGRGKEELSEFLKTKSLDFDVLVIDEVSMVPTWLIGELLKKKRPQQLILIGDKNQLQPVGWGSFMRELLKFGKIPTIVLDRNHRSKTVMYRMVDNKFISGEHFHLIPGTVDTVAKIYQKLMKVDHHDPSQVMVLTSHVELVEELNRRCQEIVKVGEPAIEGRLGRSFHLRDKVIMKKNNYVVGQMNGDLGRITELGEKTITVKFRSGNLVDFYLPTEKELLTNQYSKERSLNTTLLDLAFCTTVHKSQGSESPIIILYVKPGLRADRINDVRMFNQCWLYTALSRAEQEIYCIGDPEAMNWMSMMGPPTRIDCLSQWIEEYLS